MHFAAYTIELYHFGKHGFGGSWPPHSMVFSIEAVLANMSVAIVAMDTFLNFTLKNYIINDFT